MSFRKTLALMASAIGFGLIQGLPGESLGRTAALHVMRLPRGFLSVELARIRATSVPDLVQADVTVALTNTGPRSVAVSRSDFALSVQADLIGVQTWDAGNTPLAVRPGQSRVFRLTFRAPSEALERATFFYRPSGGGAAGDLPLNGSADFPSADRRRAVARASTYRRTRAFGTSRGVGEPLGLVRDGSGNIWFAEPGCDFAPTCSPGTPPGQIGELRASSHAIVFYRLPNRRGNQPIFVTFDNRGKLWFTTPNNSRIGEFDPSRHGFVGQWSVKAGSGPWDLTFARGRIWYTEHFGSGVGRFNPSTHGHRDFYTPSPNSEPYGIAASREEIWFTENNSNIDRVAVLDTRKHGAIREYPVVLPLNGTPHMISIGRRGHPWWTEGFSGTIATLDPAAARAGRCGVTSGTCRGIRRFRLPRSAGCSVATHTSGIGFDRARHLVWIDDSLTSQVGSFDPSNRTFTLSTLTNCNAHPGDGLSVARAIWFDEEFGNAIGELVP